MKTILAVIDMQPKFSAANDKTTIQNVVKAIKTAIRYKQTIFLVKYHNTKVVEPVVDALKGYKNVFKIIKERDDGSKQIASCIISNHIQVKYVTDACVKSTVDGLRKYFQKKIPIHIIADACNTTSTWTPAKTFRRRPVNNRIVVA